MKHYIYYQKSNIFWTTSFGWVSIEDAQAFSSFEEALSIKNEFYGEKNEMIKILSEDELAIMEIIE